MCLGPVFAVRPLHARAASDFTLVDLIELEIGHSTIGERFYRHVTPQAQLDGARTGIVAYLRGQGIADPQVAYMHARADGRGAIPAIEQQLAKLVERYPDRIQIRELIYATLRGELSALRDPYSVFFTKADLDAFTTALNGETYGGIGVELAHDDATRRWRVEHVFTGAPAARAGVEPGDEIAAIDGAPVVGVSLEDTSKRLRGKIGSVVRIEFARGATSLELALVRAQVTTPEVASRMMAGDIGYVALRSFGATAAEEVRGALRELDKDGARALILDLRGNGGGYETAAIRVASTFVSTGPIVAVLTEHGKRHVTDADGSAPAWHPLAVLVDGDSASGSEIVAAAVQDNAVGTLVGERTFGKGLVQEMFPLPDGSAFKLTTTRYFTASGRDIDHVGVTPDVVVAEPANAALGVPGRDAQLDRALVVLQNALGVAPSPNPSPSATPNAPAARSASIRPSS